MVHYDCRIDHSKGRVAMTLRLVGRTAPGTRLRSQMKLRGNKSCTMEEVQTTYKTIARKVISPKKVNVASLNSHLVCVLCSGYYVEATAIVECLHTFCRSCIVKYIQTNHFCPICDVQIHHSKPWSSLRPDKTLQDLVYKLVPGMYQDEMNRRREFYSRMRGEPDVEDGEARGYLPQGARFFSQDDSISLSLEYYSGFEEEENQVLEEYRRWLKEKPRRYLQCPAAVTVRHLKKFVRMKYGIGVDSWVDVIYNDECLPEDFSLIDVAYTFTWKRTSPMRFSYRIFSRVMIKAIRPQMNIQSSKVEEEDKKKTKQQSTLEQQRKQSEYLGNLNLNPTNSKLCKTLTPSKTKTSGSKHSHSNNQSQSHSHSQSGHKTNKSQNSKNSNTSSSSSSNNNNSTLVKNNNTASEKKSKKEESHVKVVKIVQDEKVYLPNEDSDSSGLQIIMEKGANLKGTNEDSGESVIEIKQSRKSDSSMAGYGEETVDSFTAKKLLRSKQKSDEKKEKKRLEGTRGEKRRRSAGHVENYAEEKKRNSSKRRRSLPTEEYTIKRDSEAKILKNFPERNEEESPENLKSEALRKVFVTKEKPDSSSKKKDGDGRRKKRKKSKHHDSDNKRRKMEDEPTSPSILTFASDPLKLKVKLNQNKPVISQSETPKEDHEKTKKKKEVEKEQVHEVTAGNSQKEKQEKKTEEKEAKKPKTAATATTASTTITTTSAPTPTTDKERLLHLRAVRHKSASKNISTEIISAPPSLTISKVDSSEPQPVKTTVDESKPSLEIVLVNPTDNGKTKKVENKPEPQIRFVEPPDGDTPADIFEGVLDLSEKSTRSKDNSASNSKSPSPTCSSASEATEKSRKNSHQSILQIAQSLVSRQMTPMLQDSQFRNPFEGNGDPVVTAAAMRNLKTLSDTAVNILMAAQNNFGTSSEQASCAMAPSVSSTSNKTTPVAVSSAKPGKDGDSASGLKIPTYPVSRDRNHAIPPVPNLQEIYPRGRGRSLTMASPVIKPGQNQTVRHIPNPFAVLNRQGNQNQNAMRTAVSTTKPNEEDPNGNQATKQKQVPGLQCIKTNHPGGSVMEDHSQDKNERPDSSELKAMVPKMLNNGNGSSSSNNNNSSSSNSRAGNHNNSDTNFRGVRNGEERYSSIRYTSSNVSSVRRMEHMTKNIESVAAGLTARAASNAMVDAK